MKFTIPSIILLITFLVNLFIALFVLIKGNKQKSRTFFSILIFFIVLWNLSNFFSFTLINEKLVIFWTKFAIAPALFIPILLLLFCLNFPNYQKIKLNKFLIIFFPAIISVPFLFTKYNVVGFTSIVNGNYFIPGKLYIWLVIYFVFYIFLSVAILLKNYKRASTSIAKKQIIYLLIGITTTALIGIVTNGILPLFLIAKYNIYGTPVSIVFGICTAYAITRYRFMDIQVMIRKSIIYFLLLVIIVLISISGIILFYYFLTNYLFLQKEIALLISIALLVIILPTVQKYLKSILDKYINKDIIDLSVSVEKFATSLSRSQELDVFLKRVDEFVKENIDTNNIKIAIRDIRVPELQYVCQLPKNNVIEQITELKELQNYCMKNPININDELQYLETKNKEEQTAVKIIKRLLEKNKAQCIIALRNAETINGFLIIGKKVNNESYSTKEINFITEFAKQTEDLLERVMFYEETLERVRRDYLDNKVEDN